MKLASVLLENFRQFERREFVFTDSLDRVRERSLLVGPNGSGKTTILDAIALALGPTTELTTTRPDIRLSPASIVRRGEHHTFVTCRVRFSPDEIEAAQKLFRLTHSGGKVPEVSEATFRWKYPSDRGARGFTECDPPGAWMLLKGRKTAIGLLATRAVGWDWIRQLGAVFTFDSNRTQFGKTIPEDIARIMGGHEDDGGGPKFSNDPRSILISLAVASQFPEAQPGPNADLFPRIQAKYAELCAPRRIVGAVRNDLNQLDIQFSDGRGEYLYDGLSSGEAMVLQFLIRMIGDHIHRSILLVEEVELHQHPIWQRRLLHLLADMGEDNQIIATTHSDYLRDIASPAEVIELGALRPEDDDA